MLDRPKFAGDVGPSGKDPSLVDFIERRGVEIIYDIGAKVGQFGLALSRRGYSGLIVSFEPRSSNYAALVQTAAVTATGIVFTARSLELWSISTQREVEFSKSGA
jgi:FkbM family methyltransferase